MSLDCDDPELDRALDESGRQFRTSFQPPDLDAMLARATGSSGSGRRWLWPALAAVLLLAIPLVTVIALHRRPHAAPAHPAPAQLRKLGPVTWHDPVWTGSVIQFAVTLSGAEVCQGAPTIRAEITGQDAHAVTIVATEYVNPDKSAETALQKQLCSGTGAQTPRYFTAGQVPFLGPLNGRIAIDGLNHEQSTVADASRVPDIPKLPAAFHSGAAFGHVQKPTLGEPLFVRVGRTWADQRVELTLTVGAANDPDSSWENSDASTIGSVNGHETRFRGMDQHELLWLVGQQVFTLTETPLNGTDDYEFSPQQLLTLARSIG